MTGRRRVDVLITDELPVCPRCTREGLLLARVPYGWANACAGRADGCTGVVLCAACDTAAPHAAPLITWFQVHGQVNGGNSEEFVRLAVAWADDLSVPPLDEQELESEFDRWRRGEL
ncbi:DUF6300 family protein [Nonomuraea sp. NPDC000554]|uniref:DUF6300 family protein n=1 Tax=Nonomuraea sp. NPDC000554 TaxID=3154259 RepID=UPI00332F66C1